MFQRAYEHLNLSTLPSLVLTRKDDFSAVVEPYLNEIHLSTLPSLVLTTTEALVGRPVTSKVLSTLPSLVLTCTNLT